MSQTYLLPKARNTVTQQTIKAQDLTGFRFTSSQSVMAAKMAQQLAEKMTVRTGELWQGFVESYVPTQRKS